VIQENADMNETQTEQQPSAEDLAAIQRELEAQEQPAAAVPPPAPVKLDAWRIKGNRFAELFESIQFHTTASGKVYTNDDGTSQRKVASGIAVYRGGFACVPFNVNAKKLSAAKNARVVAEISFVGNRGAQGLMPVGERAKAEFQELKAGLSRDFTTWRKAQGTYVAQSNGAATLEGAEDLFGE
jgi:hypothetical protein